MKKRMLSLIAAVLIAVGPALGQVIINDGDYNHQKAERERNVDAILDKVSKSGYQSLTDEEKEFLFKNSK